MTSDHNKTETESTAKPVSLPAITEPDFSGTPLPIREVASRADFPQSAHGVYIDIQGFTGVVVEIVNQSIKVRSAEGITQRFNANRLKVLYSPAERPEESSRPGQRPGLTAESISTAPTTPVRVFIAEPDFSQPLRPISQYAGQPDFPQCAYGKHVDIQGYTGVVVELVKGSLRVQTQAGTSRSFNAEVLRKLHGKRG